MATQIWEGTRVIGTVSDGVFYKRVTAKGYLQKPPALALSVQSISAAREAGAETVVIRDDEKNVTYTARLDYLKTYGFDLRRSGYEPQIGLPLARWTLTRQKPNKDAGPSITKETSLAAPIQFKLF